MLIAEQGAVGTSYGGWLADEIQRRFFDWLDAPVQRVTGGEASPSISKVLERAAIAQKRRGRRRAAPRSRGTDVARVLRMPEVAANTTEAVLAEWLVAEDAEFAAGDALATVETDKALVDVEAEAAGVVAQDARAAGCAGRGRRARSPCWRSPGETVDDLDALLRELGVAEASAAVVAGAPRRARRRPEPEVAPDSAPGAEPAPSPPTRRPDAGRRAADRPADGRIFASPLARKIAARRRPGRSRRSPAPGPRGRILRRDVDAALAARRPRRPRRPLPLRRAAGTPRPAPASRTSRTPGCGGPIARAADREQADGAALLRPRHASASTRLLALRAELNERATAR